MIDPDRGWQNDARCAEPDAQTLDFYSYSYADQRRAVYLCRTSCPVMDSCLKSALDHEDVHGVWGGTTPTQRARALRVEDDTKRTACPRCGGRQARTSKERRVRVLATCPTCGFAWMRRRRPVVKRQKRPGQRNEAQPLGEVAGDAEVR